jgi:hypothetical protein
MISPFKRAMRKGAGRCWWRVRRQFCLFAISLVSREGCVQCSRPQWNLWAYILASVAASKIGRTLPVIETINAYQRQAASTYERP